MTAPKGALGPSRLPPALWISGGLLVLAAMVLPWTTYSLNGPAVSVSGVGLLQYLPELGALAVGGLALVLLGIGLGRGRVWSTDLPRTLPAKGVTLLVSFLSFVVPVEVAFRFAAESRALTGTTFLNAVGPGWGLALVGASLALLGALALLFQKSSSTAA